MKFACDRCGKRYASVDEPAPGRVYRIRCKCGHVIVVRGASAPRGAAEPARLRRLEAPPLPPPLEPPPAGAFDEGARRREEGPEVGAAPALGAPGEAPSAVGTLRPARGGETEPTIADDPFLRGGGEAEPEGRGSAGLAGLVMGEGAAAPPPEAPFGPAPGAVAATGARPVLSLGLDGDGASGARRWILAAALLAMLAIGAALAVWRP